MHKVDAIKELCSDLLYNQGIHCQEIMNHLSILAALIESDITQEGCDDWFERGMSETVMYIRENVALCSNRTLDDVYLLLLEVSGTVH